MFGDVVAKEVQSDPSNGSVPGLREQARQERYQRIRTAAKELFAEKGYDEVTTKEIASRAKIGEATLFRYISNKEQLLLLVIGEKQNAVVEKIEKIDEKTEKSRPQKVDGEWFFSRIYAIYKERVNFYIEDPEHVSKYVSTGLQLGNQLSGFSTETGDRIIKRLTHIIDSAQNEGYIRADINSTTIARNLNGVYIHEILRSPARSLPISETWARLHERLEAMLKPLLL